MQNVSFGADQFGPIDWNLKQMINYLKFSGNNSVTQFGVHKFLSQNQLVIIYSIMLCDLHL